MQFSVFLPQTNQVASTDAMLRTSEIAEELGFDSISVHDHIQYTGAGIASGSHDAIAGGDRRNLFEAVTTLAFLAARTSRVRLLTAILLLPVREPIVLAKQLATLDVMSGGRLECGVAVGPPLIAPKGETTRLVHHSANAVKEYAAFGLRGNRGPRTDEYLEAMIAIWTQEQATFRGRYVSFESIDIFPKPLQRPHPPIWIGGRSDHALKRAAAFAQGWFPSQMSVEHFAASLPRLRDRCALHGRPMLTAFGISNFTVIGESDAEAQALARPVLESKFTSARDYETRTIVGGPETWIRTLRAWEAAGLTCCQVKPIYDTVDDLIAQMRLIAREVMPAFRAPRASGAAASR